MTFLPTVCTEADVERSTWIEYWPPQVQALSFRQQGIELTRAQLHALARRNGIAASLFDAVGTAPLTALQAQLDRLLQQFPAGAFVRLGSRSPKDTERFVLSGGRADSGAEAIALLSAGSRRMFVDYRRCMQNHWTPSIFLREWQPMSSAQEWRCFVHERQLLGITQYWHAQALDSGACAQLQRTGIASLLQLAAQLLQRLPLPSFVFDACLPLPSPLAARAVLIEINPFGATTDAGLFDACDERLDRTIRWRSEAGVQQRPLADCCQPASGAPSTGAGSKPA
ncbi:hypothetical protein F0U62_43010 [Cystobacter fuscus]|uniref:hypothetical protein n=1 Tax=Cystobacter fuscus TaxID=43 RepID=UPI002B319147|nr:hypothetical protein F0U62_43010 [Cystobacter fuscus]